jgi:hypothetical protein
MGNVTIVAVRKLLVDTVALLSGLAAGRVLVETKADARPSDGLYATLWFKETDAQPEFGGTLNTDTGQEELKGEAYCTVQITFWGPGAYDAALNTRLLLNSSARELDLYKVVGSAGCTSVQDLSAAFAGRVQQRAFFDFSFYVCFDVEVPSDWFDTSSWVIDVYNQGSETPIEFK